MEISAKQIGQFIDFCVSQSATFEAMLFKASLSPIPKSLVDQAIQIPGVFCIDQYLRYNINTNTSFFKITVRHSNSTRVLAAYKGVIVS